MPIFLLLQILLSICKHKKGPAAADPFVVCTYDLTYSIHSYMAEREGFEPSHR